MAAHRLVLPQQPAAPWCPLVAIAGAAMVQRSRVQARCKGSACAMWRPVVMPQAVAPDLDMGGCCGLAGISERAAFIDPAAPPMGQEQEADDAAE